MPAAAEAKMHRPDDRCLLLVVAVALGPGLLAVAPYFVDLRDMFGAAVFAAMMSLAITLALAVLGLREFVRSPVHWLLVCYWGLAGWLFASIFEVVQRRVSDAGEFDPVMRIAFAMRVVGWLACLALVVELIALRAMGSARSSRERGRLAAQGR